MKLEKLCKAILALSESEIEQGMAEAQHQCSFLHPLKGETQFRVNTKGKNNLLVLQKLRELRAQMREGSTEAIDAKYRDWVRALNAQKPRGGK